MSENLGCTPSSLTKRKTQEDRLVADLTGKTIEELAEIRHQIDAVIRSGACTPRDRFMLWHIGKRVDDAVGVKRWLLTQGEQS